MMFFLVKFCFLKDLFYMALVFAKDSVAGNQQLLNSKLLFRWCNLLGRLSIHWMDLYYRLRTLRFLLRAQFVQNKLRIKFCYRFWTA